MSIRFTEVTKRTGFLPASAEKTEVAALSGGNGNKFQTRDLIHPVIHRAQNNTTDFICER